MVAEELLFVNNMVRENFQVMDQIHEVLSNDLLGVLPLQHTTSEHACSWDTLMFQADSHLGFHQDSAANNPSSLALQQPSSEMMSRSISEMSLRFSEDLNRPFQSEFNLSDQVWRSAISSNLSLNSDIFMHGQQDTQLDSAIDKVTTENLSTLHSHGGTPSTFLMPNPNAPSNPAHAEADFHVSQQVNQRIMTQSASHGLMVSQADRYRPWSGAATSSSVSSQGDSSARLSASPEPQQPQIHHNPLPNSQNSTLDRTSSSGTLRSLLNQNLRRTTSCGDQYEIQKAFSLFEAQEMQEHWRQQAGQQPELAGAQAATMNDKVTALKHDPGSLQRSTDDPPNLLKRSSNVSLVNQVSKVAGVLLRRKSLSALEVLKAVDTYHRETADKSLNLVQNIEEEPTGLATTVTENITPNLRGRRRWGMEHASSSRGQGPIHVGHDEAAVNHMMAERRRRMKQKENFTALRRLVPTISKADKASTLIDAITYLKDLQNKIQEMKASKEDINQRCETLENKCRELEDRNQQLVAMLSINHPSSSNQLDTLKSELLQSFFPSELKTSKAAGNPTYSISSDYHM